MPQKHTSVAASSVLTRLAGDGSPSSPASGAGRLPPVSDFACAPVAPASAGLPVSAAGLLPALAALADASSASRFRLRSSRRFSAFSLRVIANCMSSCMFCAPALRAC